MDVLKDLLEAQKTATIEAANGDVIVDVTETKEEVITGEVKTEEVKTDDVTVKTDDVASASIEDDEIVAEIARFKETIGFEGDLEDFSVDSIANVVKTVIEKEREAIANLTTDEDIKSLVEWKKNGYDLESFLQAPKVFNKADYSIEQDGDSILSHVYKNMKGLDEADTNSMIEALSIDPVKKQAKVEEFLGLLETTSKQAYDEYVASQQAKVDAKKEQFNQIKQSIDTGNLGYTTITDPNERVAFNKYLNSNEVDKKWANLTPQQTAMIEYLIYKDFNIGDFKKPVVSTVKEDQKRKPIQIVNITSKTSNTSDAGQDALLKKLLNN